MPLLDVGTGVAAGDRALQDVPGVDGVGLDPWEPALALAGRRC